LSFGLRGIVAFDLDGTLLRGSTTCELLAQPLGRLVEMQRFESLSSESDVAEARLEMARWYQGHSPAQLCAALESATWAPGAYEGVRLLQERGVGVIIASVTWQFAVEWLARHLGIARVLGTQLEPSGRVSHVWPRDKARCLRQVSSELGVASARVAAVGDSHSDSDLLAAASLRFYVGPSPAPPLSAVNHRPGGNIEAIAHEVLASWAA
jgi:phosphoserine phosphatase